MLSRKGVKVKWDPLNGDPGSPFYHDNGDPGPHFPSRIGTRDPFSRECGEPLVIMGTPYDMSLL